MRYLSKRITIFAMICCLITSLTFATSASSVFAADADTSKVFKGRVFSEHEAVATPITRAGIAGAVIGKEDGKDVVYTTVNAELASFQIVDIESNTLVNRFELPGVQQAWAHAIAPDGTVYIGGIRTSGLTTGILWSYSPETKTVTNLGELTEKSIWSLTIDPSGNVYMGTFQAGKVIKYDPVTKKFKDYGSMVQGQEYVRSLAYYDGYLYAGIGTTGTVVKLDVEGEGEGTKENIGTELSEILGVPAKDIPFAYDMAVVNDILLVKFQGDLYKLAFYDLKKQEWLDFTIGKDSGLGTGAGVFNFAQLAVDGDIVYLPAHGHVTALNLKTFEQELIVKFGTSFRSAALIELEGDEEKSLVSMNSAGSILVVDLEEGKLETRVSRLVGAPNPIHNIEVGPDGKLYMSAYPAGTGAIFDPMKDTFVNLTMEQAEGMVPYGDYMYFGMYPGGHIERLDTTRATPSIEKVFTIGEAQDRPYIMKQMEDKLMFGSIPGYGELGGALTIYDPKTGETNVYRNVVENQSIVGLAYKDGLIYGSTTVYGGLGSTPTERSAKMFVWDVAAEKKIAEFTLELPGLSNPPMISALTFGPDGNLWGAVNGIVFVMDSKTYEIINYNNIYPEINSYGMWRPYHAHWGEDGLLYIDLVSRITVIDPKTLNFVRLFEDSLEVKFMTLAKDATGQQAIYFADATDMGSLQKISVTDFEYEHAGKFNLVVDSNLSLEAVQNFEVGLQLDAASELYSFEAKVSYDATKLEVANVTATEAWSKDGVFTYAAKDGVLTIVGTQLTAGLSGDAIVANIEFKPLSNFLNTSVTLLAETASIRIDGDVTEKIHLLGENRTISIRVNSYVEDVNNDGKVDQADLTAIIAQLNKEVNATNAHMDINDDGKINVIDAGIVALSVNK